MRQDLATPHRRQLICIAYEHETGVLGKGFQQGTKETEIDHRGLVDHQCVDIEGSTAIA